MPIVVKDSAFDLQQIMEEECGHETEDNEHDDDDNHDAKRSILSSHLCACLNHD